MVLTSAQEQKTSVPVQAERQKAEDVGSFYTLPSIGFRSSVDKVASPTLGRAIHFTKSTDSNAHVTQKHPHERAGEYLI